MSDNNSSNRLNLIVSLVVILRVTIVLIVWLGLFLAIFLGYFTVPILVIGIITIIYAISDVGIFVMFRRRKKMDDEMRKSLSKKLEEHPHLDSRDFENR